MDELVKQLIGSFRNFIYRDLIYVVGGSTAITAMFYAANRLPELATLPLAGIALFAGLGYVVGYGLQEGMSVLRFVTTAYYAPGKFIRWLGARFSPGENWSVITPAKNVADMQLLQSCVDAHTPDWSRRRRTVDLKQLSATMAATGLVCVVLLLVRLFVICIDSLTVLILIGSAVITAIFVVVNRFKSAQQCMIERYTYLRCDVCNPAVNGVRPNKAFQPTVAASGGHGG